MGLACDVGRGEEVPRGWAWLVMVAWIRRFHEVWLVVVPGVRRFHEGGLGLWWWRGEEVP